MINLVIKKLYSMKFSLLMLILICSNISMLAIYFNKTALVYFNSDTASNLLLANEIARGGRVIVDDWIYNNKDVFFLNYELIAAGLLKFYSAGYGVHAYASIIFSVVILVALFFLIFLLTGSHLIATFVVAIFSSGISSPFITQLLYDWGGSYGAYMLLSLSIWVALQGWLKNLSGLSRNKKYTYLVIIFLLVLAGSASNPSRAILYLVAPSFATILLWYFLYCDTKLRKYPIEIVSISIMLILGFICGNLINVTASSGESILSAPKIYGVNDLPEHISIIFKGYLYLFGYPSENAAQPNLYFGKYLAQSLPGIYLMITSIMAISSLALPISLCCKVLRNYRTNSLIYFPATLFFLSLFIHIACFRYPNSSDLGSIRYIFVPIMLILIYEIIHYKKFIIDLIKNNFIRTIIICSTLFLISYMNYVFPGKNIDIHNLDKISFVKCLEKNNVSYGFSDFWDASSTTVLSDSKVIARPVIFQNDGIERFPFLIAKNWYENRYGEYFIAIPAEKNIEIIDSNLNKKLITAKRKFQCQDRNIYVMDGGTKDLFIRPKQYIGFIKNLPASTIISKGKNESGFVIFGNYTKIKSGKYNMNYEVTSSDNEYCGYVDVVSNLGNNLINKFDIGIKAHLVSIYIPEDTDSLEIRLFSSGKCKIAVLNNIELISTE